MVKMISMHRAKLQVSEAARYTNLSVSTLNKLRLYGGGPTFIKIGRRVVYDPDDIDEWLAANRRASTSSK